MLGGLPLRGGAALAVHGSARTASKHSERSKPDIGKPSSKAAPAGPSSRPRLRFGLARP
jgi:hypothetical protein